MTSVVDNDILIKSACYGLMDEFVVPKGTAGADVGILGAARFVVPKQILKKAPQRGTPSALSAFEDFLHRSLILEPTRDEQSMAAKMELAAQRNGLNLDTGESQLCAIAILRGVPLLLTGDKRAIRAIECLLMIDCRLAVLCNRVKCLEQLVLDALTTAGSTATIRPAICGESHIDKALTICFACHSPELSLQEALVGLQSYINDLRSSALRVLAA